MTAPEYWKHWHPVDVIRDAESEARCALATLVTIEAIRATDGWGEKRANLLAREHVEPRELFQNILDRLRETNRASILLGRELPPLNPI